MYFSDDDIFNYQIKNQQARNGQDVYEEKGESSRITYYIPTANKSGGKKKGKGAGTGVNASLDEILEAINQIIGNLDDVWIKGDTNMLDNQIAYIKKALPMMICMHLKYPDIFVSTGMIQNTQESGWNGNDSVPGSNNFFGIKDGGRPQTEYWHGDVVNRWAVEGGMANFCKYPDLVTSVMDYGAFLKTNSRYGKAGVFEATGPVEQITRIMDAGYAPGSESMYISHANSLTNRLKFGRFDELADKVVQLLAKDSGTEEYEDEWNPTGGSLDKVKEAGIELEELSAKRLKILAEAESLLGTPYVFGGTKVPDKDADGKYIVTTGGLDCSSFVQRCYNVGLGVDITRTTFTQAANSMFEVISPSEAKPGDLWQPHVNHTTMLLKYNSNGTNKIIHEPQTGRVCSLEDWKGNRGIYYRYKGIDS